MAARPVIRTCWEPPPLPDYGSSGGQHRSLDDVLAGCTPEMQWNKITGFAELSGPGHTIRDICWSAVLKLVLRSALTGTTWAHFPEQSFNVEIWQNVLHTKNLHTVEGLGLYLREWMAQDGCVHAWISGRWQCHKATADLGGWLLDNVNTLFMVETERARPDAIYRVIDNRLYKSLGTLLLPHANRGLVAVGNIWEQLGWHAFERGRGEFLLALVWNTTNRNLTYVAAATAASGAAAAAWVSPTSAYVAPQMAAAARAAPREPPPPPPGPAPAEISAPPPPPPLAGGVWAASSSSACPGPHVWQPGLAAQAPSTYQELIHPQCSKMWKYRLTCQYCGRTELIPPGVDAWYHGQVTQGQSPQDYGWTKKKNTCPACYGARGRLEWL